MKLKNYIKITSNFIKIRKNNNFYVIIKEILKALIIKYTTRRVTIKITYKNTYIMFNPSKIVFS